MASFEPKMVGGRVDNGVGIKDIWTIGMADWGNRVRDKMTDFRLGSWIRVKGGETSLGASESRCSQPRHMPLSIVSITAHLSFILPSWKTTVDIPALLSLLCSTLLTFFPSNRASFWIPGKTWQEYVHWLCAYLTRVLILWGLSCPPN